MRRRELCAHEAPATRTLQSRNSALTLAFVAYLNRAADNEKALRVLSSTGPHHHGKVETAMASATVPPWSKTPSRGTPHAAFRRRLITQTGECLREIERRLSDSASVADPTLPFETLEAAEAAVKIARAVRTDALARVRRARRQVTKNA